MVDGNVLYSLITRDSSYLRYTDSFWPTCSLRVPVTVNNTVSLDRMRMDLLQDPTADSRSNVLSKYRGCLMGALTGDCIGRLFEFKPPIPVVDIEIRIQHHEQMPDKPLPFTDDTAMCHALAESLLRCKGLDLKDVAQGFTETFYSQPEKMHMYARVIDMFKAWRRTQYEGDLFGPSKAQFKGSGSYGNGGGMRISGVPLFYGDEMDIMLQTAKATTQLTHYHQLGFNGALLQAYAVYLALHTQSELPEPYSFIEELLAFAQTYLNEGKGDSQYVKRLREVRKLLTEDVTVPEHVIRKLGETAAMNALDAIPMAIFCATRALSPIPGIMNDNPFERAILYAISMGGDTDTVGTMAGAISGAWFGIERVPQEWQNMCQAAQKTQQLADELHSWAHGSNADACPVLKQSTKSFREQMEENRKSSWCNVL